MRLRATFILLALTMLVPAARAAASGPLVGMADDRVLLAGGPAADRAVNAWAAHGVDVVRIFAVWNRIVPGARTKRKPASVTYDFSRIDAGVDRVRAAGMDPMVTLTGPGPLWASQKPSGGSVRYKPSAKEYARFAAAAAKHFAGRVHRYILWNEPNLAAWLLPQSSCHRRHCSPVSPNVYRDLINAAAPAIRAVDPSADVFIGALGPRGASVQGPGEAVRPLAFLRGLACVDSHLRRIHSGACRRFVAPRATALAYHGHSLKYSPTKPFGNPDDANLASLPRLESLLDKLRRGHRLKIGSGIWIDEYGYQTNPPDRYLGVSARNQDRWLQEGDYRASRDRRVKLVTQYVWIDEPRSRHQRFDAGWQSGMYYTNGRAKPALAHFADPFFLDAARSLLWGQVRPGGAHPVLVQRRAHGSRKWRTVARLRTDRRGYWTKRMALSRGMSYRFVAADGATRASSARTR